MENISDNTCAICHEEKNLPSTTESSRTLRGSRAFARVQKQEVLTKLPCGHEFHYACIKPWANKNPRCPIDLRLITNTPFCSVNMREELMRSVKGGQIENVREILSTGFNLNQRSFLHRENPLSVSLKGKQWEISAELIRAGATTSNKMAQHHLGWMHQKGLGVQQNYAEALTWYRKAADRGYGAAQNQLGWMHQKGLGVQQNYAEALSWYRKAAGQDDAAGQNNLGCMHLEGLGGKQNYAKALTWYRKAANQGYVLAESNLGWIHQNGLGVKQNYAEALIWYRKAANQGYAFAQNQLGWMHQNGLGVEQNYAEALTWYRKAASQGHAVGQNNLSWMHQNGLGVEQ